MTTPKFNINDLAAREQAAENEVAELKRRLNTATAALDEISKFYDKSAQDEIAALKRIAAALRKERNIAVTALHKIMCEHNTHSPSKAITVDVTKSALEAIALCEKNSQGTSHDY